MAVREMLWALGLVGVAGVQAFADGSASAPAPGTNPPAASSISAGSTYEQRLEAMEQQLEELKLAQAEQTAKNAGGANTLRAYWDKTLKFETQDKQFTVRAGGRINYDMGFIKQDAANTKKFGMIPNQSEFRRARIELEGTAYSNFYWKFQVDFGGGAWAFKDVYMGIKDIPVVGAVQVGNQYEPFVLEHWTSDKYDPFIEYSLPGDAFAPQRHPGIVVLNNYKERVAWQFGLFRGDSDSLGTESSNSGYAFTGRLSGTPLYLDEGKELIHLGVAYSRRDPLGAAVSYSDRPEWHGSSKKFVSASVSKVDAVDLLGLEAAAVWGPVSVQGEFIQSNLTRTSGGGNDASFNGWYVEGSWFITGENRKYNGKTGEFTRVSPKKDFGKDGGFGAWEAVARYSSLDLNDTSAKIAGGKENDLTLGLNWYLNPNMRVMFNYIHAMTSTPDVGSANIALVRFQADF